MSLIPLNYHFFFFFIHLHHSPLWALACLTMSFHFFLSATNSLHLLTPSTCSTSSFHLFLGLHLRLVPSSSWVKIFLGILSSSILSIWTITTFQYNPQPHLCICPILERILKNLLWSGTGSCNANIYKELFPPHYHGICDLSSVVSAAQTNNVLQDVIFHHQIPHSTYQTQVAAVSLGTCKPSTPLFDTV